MNKVLVIGLFLLLKTSVSAQEIRMSEIASLEQVYGEIQKSQAPISMNELGMGFGYVLYETQISVNAESVQLDVENVRDYAAVYVDGKFQGGLTDDKKTLSIHSAGGQHKLQLYVENIGRITYGPEILDNSKGMFGTVTLDGEGLENWNMIPLLIKECPVNDLKFSEWRETGVPCFYKGTFSLDNPQDTHLNVSGWGMGEVWINGQYVGFYWEENPQQSIQIPASALVKGNNHLIVFELKKNGKRTMSFSDKIIFN